jgi:hypothetical protein
VANDLYWGHLLGKAQLLELPQLAQVASNIYQEISKLSKVARIENTLEPQGQACSGPKDLRSVPNLAGSFSLFFRRVGRRNILLRSAPSCGQSPRRFQRRLRYRNSPSAHIINTSDLVIRKDRTHGVSPLHPSIFYGRCYN